MLRKLVSENDIVYYVDNAGRMVSEGNIVSSIQPFRLYSINTKDFENILSNLYTDPNIDYLNNYLTSFSSNAIGIDSETYNAIFGVIFFFKDDVYRFIRYILESNSPINPFFGESLIRNYSENTIFEYGNKESAIYSVENFFEMNEHYTGVNSYFNYSTIAKIDGIIKILNRFKNKVLVNELPKPIVLNNDSNKLEKILLNHIGEDEVKDIINEYQQECMGV